MLTVKDWLIGVKGDLYYRERLNDFLRFGRTGSNFDMDNVRYVFYLCGYNVQDKDIFYMRRMYSRVVKKLNEPLDLEKIKSYRHLRRYCMILDESFGTSVYNKYSALMDATYFLSAKERLDLAVSLIKCECF